MNERTDYNPLRQKGEGYYSLVSNSGDEAHIKSPWPEAEAELYKSPAQNQAEQVSELQP